MDRATAGRHYSSAVQMYDNENLSTMSSIRSMRSARRIQILTAGSSTNRRDQNVGVDCSAVDRVWALYGVDELLSYDLSFISHFFLWFLGCREFVFMEGFCWWENVLVMSFVSIRERWNMIQMGRTNS